jgi:hypothetical protein
LKERREAEEAELIANKEREEAEAAELALAEARERQEDEEKIRELEEIAIRER